MRKFFGLGLAAALLAAPPSHAQTPAWSSAIHGPGNAAAYLGDGYIITRSLAADASGNVVATGSTHNGTQSDFMTTKLSASTGAVAWQKVFAGAGNKDDDALSVAIDAAGNAVVAGLSFNASGAVEIKAIKYAAADGSVLWDRSIPSGTFAGAYVVALDGNGNAFLGAEGNASGASDIRVIKLASATGATIWDQSFNGGSDDFVSDLAVDAEGNAVVVGVSANASGNDDFRILKYNGATGALLWQQSFNGGTRDEAYGLALDASGNAFLIGLTSGANADFKTIKYAAASGTVMWQATFDGGRNDYVQSIAVDAAGNAVVTGQMENAAGNFDFKTLKYAAATGAVLWEKSFDGGANDYVYQVAIDNAGNAVVTGSAFNGANADWKTIAYASGDGSVLFEHAYGGSGNQSDEAYALAVGPNAVYVGGIAAEAGAPASARVVKLPLVSPASITSPAPGTTLAGASQLFTWNDAGASLYQVFVGNSVGAYDIGYFPSAGTTGLSTTLTGLPTDGRKVYVRLYSSIGGTYYYRDYTYTAAGSGGSTGAPSPASITSPANGAKLAGASQAFQWNNGGASLYQLWIGNSPGAYDIGYFPAAGTPLTTATVTGLPTDGRTLYVRLYSAINGVWESRDFTYTAAGSGGSTPPVPSPASIASPAAGSTLTGSSQVFQWNDGGASLYQLWIGSSPGAYDVGYFPASGTTQTSITASGLPTDGRTLHVRLYSAIDGAWQFRDFTYTAAGSAAPPATPTAASLTSPAPGSTLAGASQLFQWNDSGASMYQLFVGNSPGAFDVGYFPAAGTTSTSTTATGLPTDGRTLYVRLYSAIDGAWQYRDFTYRARP